MDDENNDDDDDVGSFFTVFEYYRRVCVSEFCVLWYVFVLNSLLLLCELCVIVVTLF